MTVDSPQPGNAQDLWRNFTQETHAGNHRRSGFREIAQKAFGPERAGAKKGYAPRVGRLLYRDGEIELAGRRENADDGAHGNSGVEKLRKNPRGYRRIAEERDCKWIHRSLTSPEDKRISRLQFFAIRLSIG